jgi:hypothetical protein
MKFTVKDYHKLTICQYIVQYMHNLFGVGNSPGAD